MDELAMRQLPLFDQNIVSVQPGRRTSDGVAIVIAYASGETRLIRFATELENSKWALAQFRAILALVPADRRFETESDLIDDLYDLNGIKLFKRLTSELIGTAWVRIGTSGQNLIKVTAVGSLLSVLPKSCEGVSQHILDAIKETLK